MIILFKCLPQKGGKQEKSQLILDSIMNRFYDMGKYKLASAGMDDAGEMSSWFVFNAMGFYPLSPADDQYIVSVPIFRKIEIESGGNKRFTILKKGDGRRIVDIRYGSRKIDGYFISDKDIKEGKQLDIITQFIHNRTGP